MRIKRVHILGMLLILVFIATPVWAADPVVNMNVTDAEVRDVLTALAAIGRVNMVADDSVSGRITVKLVDVPFETALDIVTRTKGLTYQNVGNVIIVGAANQLNRNFGTIHIFKLKYAKATDAVQLLSVIFKDSAKATDTTSLSVEKDRRSGDQMAKQTEIKDYSSPSNKKASPDQQQTPSNRLKVDEVTNSIIFSGTPDEVEQVEKILAEVDIPYEQVSLEAEVVAITKQASKDLGIEWTWSQTPTYPTIDTSSSSSSSSTTITRTENSGTVRFGRSPIGLPYEFYYKAKINALVSNGDAKVLAKPKITTINGKEATINIGDEVPISTTTTSNNITTTSIEYKNAGIILKYTPRVNDNGQITSVVHTEVSSPTYDSDTKAYRFTTRSADTEVRLKDGETMVIGGLINKEETKAMSKVPFLSDLPFLGGLFRNINNTKNENEVIIFLTARIVK